VQLFGRDESQDAIAQELKPLVGALLIGARMGERALEEALVLEGVTEALFELSRLR
jgi:hypothetical protein